jgi:multiple sugar transport system permease protein
MDTTSVAAVDTGTGQAEASRLKRSVRLKSSKPRPRNSLGRKVTPYAFLGIPVGLLITFTYVPVVAMLYYSLTNWDGLDQHKEFIGLRNYESLLHRPELFDVLEVSLYYIGASFVQLALALYFATILSFNVRFRNVFKGIFFFPYMINGVAIGMIFLYFFQPNGTLNSLLHLVHAGGLKHQWLGDPSINNYSLAATSVWRYTGLNFVLFLGAIQSIPAQLYEAAAIDGANRWQQFRYIILPGIRMVVSLSFILAISGSLAVFEIPFVMTTGSNGTMTFVIETWYMAFRNYKVGLASAMAVVLLALILIVTWIQQRLARNEKVNLT